MVDSGDLRGGLGRACSRTVTMTASAAEAAPPDACERWDDRLVATHRTPDGVTHGHGGRRSGTYRMTLILDAGAFVALERNDRAMWRRFKAAQLAGVPPRTHGGVIAQVWRGGAGRQAPLSLALIRSSLRIRATSQRSLTPPSCEATSSLPDRDQANRGQPAIGGSPSPLSQGVTGWRRRWQPGAVRDGWRRCRW